MTLTIRSLEARDETAWASLWRAYLDFYQTTVPNIVYTTTFQRLLDPRRPQQFGLVAEIDETLAGLVHTIVHPHNWRIEDVFYLQDLYVDPACRGTGVGRALIEAVYERADGNGTPSVYWLTQEFNAPARLLYDRIANVTPFIKYQR